MIPKNIDLLRADEWKDITLEVQSIGAGFKASRNILDTQEVEIIIDDTSVAVIDSSFFNKGIKLTSNIPSVDIYYDVTYKYYARTTGSESTITLYPLVGADANISFPTDVKIRTTIADDFGNEVQVGAFGSLQVASMNPQLSATFDHPLSSRDFKVVGTPTSQANRSLLQVSDGDLVETIATLRYKTAQTIQTYFTAGFNGIYASGISYIGLFDISDGVFVGFKGGDFVVGYRNIYADDGVGSEPDVIQVVDTPTNVSNLTRYRIRFGYLGVGNITYEYFNGLKWILMHQFMTDNQLSNRTHIGSPILPMRSECSHSGCSVLSGSWNASTLGQDTGLQNKPFFIDGERVVAGSTIAQPLVAFRSKGTFGGFPSKIKSQLLSLEIATGSEGLYKFEIYKFPSGTLVSGTWSDVDIDSVMQENNTFTELSSQGIKLFAKTIAIGSSGNGVATVLTDFKKLGVIANPNDEFAIFKRELVGGVGDDITSWSLSFLDLK